AGENVKGRHLWPGNAPYRINSKGWPPEEIADQIKVTRAQKGAAGNIHFSMKTLMKDGPAADALKSVYTEPALVPASPWLGDVNNAGRSPAKPRLEWVQQSGKQLLRITPPDEPIRLFVVRSQNAGKWAIRIQTADRDKPVDIPFETMPDHVTVSAI